MKKKNVKNKNPTKLGHAFYSGPRPIPGPFEEADHRTIEKKQTLRQFLSWLKILIWQILGCWLELWQYFF